MSTGQFIKPGSAHYFKGWNVTTKNCQKSEPHKATLKDSWKTWSDINQADGDRSTSSLSGPAPEEVALACNSGEVREMQRKQANQVAFACTAGRNNKAARMFQKRFERSEKFALVKQPEVRQIVTEKTEGETENNPKTEKENKNPVEKHEPAKALSKQTEETSPETDPSPPQTKIFISEKQAPLQGSLINSSPRPWGFVSEPPASPPPLKNFNRRPRGFLGTYVSPYGTYALPDGTYETEDL